MRGRWLWFPKREEFVEAVPRAALAAHAPIQLVKELPMTGVGKVDKKVLRARFWEGRGRMVG